MGNDVFSRGNDLKFPKTYVVQCTSIWFVRNLQNSNMKNTGKMTPFEGKIKVF
jgi:hypothetical protein